jgi:glycerol-3-phosphate cytidylyltransferase
MRRVLTVGTFDPLHSGHLGLFEQCRRLAGPDAHLIVGVNGDAFIAGYRGAAPMLPQTVRADVVAALRVVDEVIINDSHNNQHNLIRAAAPDILVVGQDWATRDYPAQLGVDAGWFDRARIQLCYVPRTGDWSSTALKRAS